MSRSNPQPLRLGLLGLDPRAANMFRLFLKSPCHDCAAIVDEGQAADAYLVDVDSRQGAELLIEYRKAHPDIPFIVLSVKRYATSEGLIFVQKPARTEAMQSAIKLARELASAPRSSGATQPDAGDQVLAMKVIRSDDRSSKGATHRVAMLMDEQSFRSYLGHRDDVDPNKPALWSPLFFDPSQHLQAYLEYAVKKAMATGRPIRVETPWKPLYVLPEQRRIWIDADEAQLRSACTL
ncbi:MAG: uncharacterized protein H6R26_1083, partial [Proteobacteria bacterium]|nr:uncharacterized protein [Pseudomonadota bacterium]